jgi:hypothetical protein
MGDLIKAILLVFGLLIAGALLMLALAYSYG